MQSHLILIGGFLGAGKTTLLWKTAQILAKEKQTVGLITNDQASGLVDTSFLLKTGGTVEEVSGSCFCCNFHGFADCIKGMQGRDITTIIAEPVGSCTDLCATVMQPLKRASFMKNTHLAPLNVAVDPDKLQAILDDRNPGMHESAFYIMKKQLEEADIILINKCDLLEDGILARLLLDTREMFKDARVYAVSGKTGEGLKQWLDDCLADINAGTHLTQVDYDIYAQGEAVLGWLNVCFHLHGNPPKWNTFADSLLNNIKAACLKKQAAIGHIKILLEGEEDYIIGNLTGGMEDISLRGGTITGQEIILTINARVEMSPVDLQKLVLCALEEECENTVSVETDVLNCLQPGRPNPTYRYEKVV